jgi:hypothetical protein
VIGDGGERVVNDQGRVGTRHLAGHGRTEPETQIVQVGVETVVLDSRTSTFTRLSGREVLFQEETDVFGGDIGTPTEAADLCARIGCSKGADYGNGGIRGQSLVMNELRADTELVGLVEVGLRPDDTGDVCLWTVDIPFEREGHVIPFDR